MQPLHVDGELDVGSASMASQSRVTTASGSTTGTSPFFVQLLRKMSEKLGEITASKPSCWMAHTACSRDGADAEARTGDEDRWRPA